MRRRRGIDSFEYKPVSVVMPVLNNLSWTKKCIESFFAMNPRECEFIVIDNASTDGTHEYLKEMSQRHSFMRIITNEKNTGVAASWNQGVKEAKHPYVCIINNDIIFLTQDPLLRMQKVLHQYPSVLWASPRTVYSLDPKEQTLNPSHWEQLVYNKKDRRTYVVACCFMCPSHIFSEEEIGLFDENFKVAYFEDLDYISRIMQKRKRVKMCGDVTVFHGVGTTSRKAKGTGGNEDYYNKKWGNTDFHVLAMQPGRDKEIKNNSNNKKGKK